MCQLTVISGGGAPGPEEISFITYVGIDRFITDMNFSSTLLGVNRRLVRIFNFIPLNSKKHVHLNEKINRIS